MKPLIAFIFILLSSSSKLWACGPFYPYGDDIRFHLMSPELFDNEGFKIFNYSAFNFYHKERWWRPEPEDLNIELGKEMNAALWRAMCNNEPDLDQIIEGVYSNDLIGSPALEKNSFANYLIKHNKNELIDYLNFAKKCNSLNTLQNSDPWEKHDNHTHGMRQNLIKEASQQAAKCSNNDIARRYAFLALRLLYYNNNLESIPALYLQFFDLHKASNLIDYYAMYFYACALKVGPEKNFCLSQVFSFSPDKRFACFQHYHRHVAIDQTLKLAQTAKEKAAVWLLNGFENLSPALQNLQNIYKNEPNNKGLGILLMREVNKMEDWILTPYFTEFPPAINASGDDYNIDASEGKRNAFLADKIKLANELIDFVEQIDYTKVHNPDLIMTCKAYLLFATNKYNESLQAIENILERQSPDSPIHDSLNILKLLCELGRQGNSACTLQNTDETLVMNLLQSGNQPKFAAARLLEYKGNTTEAAAIYAHMNTKRKYYNNNTVYWRTLDHHHTLYSDFYYNYFFYLDAAYNIAEMEKLINRLNQKDDKSWETQLYAPIRAYQSRLYDLLGTKYLRMNQLTEALAAYNKVNDSLWQSDNFPYKKYLDSNPFFTTLVSEHEHTTADTVTYNKAEIVKKLLEYIAMGNNPHHKNRAYYYYLAGNCYFNMTQYGNSWLMKRYFWTRNENRTKLPDDDDYFKALKAKEFYLKAYDASTSEKFKVLCTLMAGKCEKYRLAAENNSRQYRYYSLFGEDEESSGLMENIYYESVYKNYPDYYKELVSYCVAVENYYDLN
ncbi:hypothetical protein GC194_03690 [bacterium]|nr:hypothetical protein [bacterium]